MPNYNVSDKISGEQFSAVEHNLMKAAVNSKTEGLLAVNSKIEGLPMGFAEPHRADFIIMASAIVFPIADVQTHGQPIIWDILTTGSAHGFSFFKSAVGNADGRLSILYPKVKKVFNQTITVDETLSQSLISVGGSVGIDSSDNNISQPSVVGIRLRGDGSTTWLRNGDGAGAFTIAEDGGGSTSFNVAALGLANYDAMSITYQGSNNYYIDRQWSGLGAYNAKFSLRDQEGTLITNPTANDNVLISNAGIFAQQVRADYWNNNNRGVFTTAANFWVTGLFEVWFIAYPQSTTEMLLKWQPYPTATNYRVNKGATVIYTGPANSFLEVGLTPQSTHEYTLFVQVASAWVELTTFKNVTH